MIFRYSFSALRKLASLQTGLRSQSNTEKSSATDIVKKITTYIKRIGISLKIFNNVFNNKKPDCRGTATSMIALKSKPLNKQQLIEQGLALYRGTFWSALPYSLIAALFIFSPQLVLEIMASTSDRLSQPSVMLSPTYITITALCWISGFLFLSALIFRLYCFCYHVPCHFVHSLKHAFSKLVPLLLLIILYALIILSGTMVMIIPGIILAVYLMFSFILVLSDNQTVLQTLILSYRLVSHHWWHTALVMSLPLLIALACSMAMFTLIVVAAPLFAISTTYLTWYTFLGNILIHVFFIPIIYSVALVLLHDLRQRQMLSQPGW